MLRVSSAEACTTPDAYHQMWVHRLDFTSGQGNLRFDAFPMHVGTDDLRNFLMEQRQAGTTAAVAAVTALREFTINRLPDLTAGKLVTASLVRICAQKEHSDGMQTSAGERAEAICRHIWGQPGLAPFSQHVKRQRITLGDEYGMGMTAIKGKDAWLRRPVAAVPLTAEEELAARWGRRELVAAGAPRAPELSVFALMHKAGGRWVEVYYRPQPEPEPVLQMEPEQSTGPRLRLVQGGRA